MDASAGTTVSFSTFLTLWDFRISAIGNYFGQIPPYTIGGEEKSTKPRFGQMSGMHSLPTGRLAKFATILGMPSFPTQGLAAFGLTLVRHSMKN